MSVANRHKRLRSGAYVGGGVVACLCAARYVLIAYEHDLGWDQRTATGVVLHMVSVVGVAGRIGVTAIADTAADAQQRFDTLQTSLAKLCARVPT